MACRCGGNSGRTKSALGSYKYLKPHQIRARLEIFKRNNCPNCETRYSCNYTMYLSCAKRPQKGV
jgi:hypothetical protein